MILKNLIVFEGLDGSGKTTQAKLLARHFVRPTLTAEPTNSCIGKLIRKALDGSVAINDAALPYLFATDRVDHLYRKDGLINSCKRGITICDRYILSSIAYAKDASVATKLNETFPIPEYIIFLSIPPEESFKRIADRSHDCLETLETQKRVARKYDALLKQYDNKTNIIKVDATACTRRIARCIWETLSRSNDSWARRGWLVNDETELSCEENK